VVRGPVVQPLMRAARVVEAEVLGQAHAGQYCSRRHAGRPLFALHDAPEPFDEDVVDPAPLAIHADGNSGLLQYARPLGTGELTAPFGIENAGAPNLAMAFSSASTQKSTVIVCDSRHAIPLRKSSQK